MDLTAAYGYRLDWIVSFVAVARHGGFIPQPPLSNEKRHRQERRRGKGLSG